jgi:hypothetical protein
MANALYQEKQDGLAKHIRADGKGGSGSETEEHLAGLNDTNVRIFVRELVALRF